MKRPFLTVVLAAPAALITTNAFAFSAIASAIASFILPAVSTAGIVGALGFTGVAYLALGIGYAVTAGALYGLASLVKPKGPSVPKPEDGKYNIKQAVPSLSYALGRNLKGGDYVFLEETGGTAYHIIVLAGHHVQKFNRFRLHDEWVTLDGSGVVNSPAHFGSNVKLDHRLGENAETAYSDVSSAFPTLWGTDYRGDGLASLMMSCATVDAQNYQKVYPQQMPLPTAEIYGNDKVYDPRTETYGYTENIALFRLWHLTNPVGGKLTLDDMYLPDWSDAADCCDETVTNRDGDDEYRYHGGFWFRAEDDPVQIGLLMDQAAELIVYERPDGKVGVHKGAYVAPDIRLTGDAIKAVSFNANRKISTNVLAVRGQYTSIDDDYSTVDAAIYGNPYVGDGTDRSKTIENQIVQSHNHMQRLQKITYTRANAPRVTIVADYQAAKNVPYRRFVKVHYPPRLDEAIIELTGQPKISLANLTVSFDGIVVPPTLYNFDAATEEGQPPVVPTANTPSGIPDPVNFDATIQQEVLAGGSTAAFAVATWDFDNAALVYEFEWSLANGTGTVQSTVSKPNDTSVRSGYLADGSEYRFRLRTWAAGVSGDWTDYIQLTAVADPTAPAQVTGASAVGGSGSIAYSWTAPNDAHYAATSIYRGTTNDFGSATRVHIEYGPQSNQDSWTETSLDAGTYYTWMTSRNASGVEATSPVASGAITVT